MLDETTTCVFRAVLQHYGLIFTFTIAQIDLVQFSFPREGPSVFGTINTLFVGRGLILRRASIKA